MRLSTHENPSERRLKLNPIEVMILFMVCTGFGFSVYNVFKESETFRFAALDPRHADPTRSVRMIASETSGVPLEVSCSQNPGFNLRGKECPPVADPTSAPAIRPEAK